MYKNGSAIRVIGRALGGIIQIQIRIHIQIKVSNLALIRVYLKDGDKNILVQEWRELKSNDRYLECICKFNKKYQYDVTYMWNYELRKTRVIIKSVAKDI